MLPAPDWLTERPIAHRGLHHAARGVMENSATAFGAAIKANCAIELDVQITSDNKLLVFHDEGLERLTGLAGQVAHMPLSDLTQIRVKDLAEPLPSLQEVLELVNGQVPIIMEVKSNYREIGARPQAVVEAVAHYSGPLAIMSFDPAIMLAIKAQNCPRPLGLVASLFPKRLWPQLGYWQRFSYRHMMSLKKLDPSFIGYNINDLPHGPISRFRANGGKVISWTVKTEEQLAKAIAFADAPIFEQIPAKDVWKSFSAHSISHP